MERKNIGQIMIDLKMLNQEQLQQALDYQQQHQCKFGKAVIELGFATRQDVFKALVHQYNYPYVDIETLEIAGDVLAMLPSHIARQYRAVPIGFDHTQKTLNIALTPPFDLSIVETLQKQLAYAVQFALTTPEQIQKCLDRYYPAA